MNWSHCCEVQHPLLHNKKKCNAKVFDPCSNNTKLVNKWTNTTHLNVCFFFGIKSLFKINEDIYAYCSEQSLYIYIFFFLYFVGAKLGNHELTRCIGNYFMKGGYSEFDILSSATAEPVIAEPYITFMPIDESCR